MANNEIKKIKENGLRRDTMLKNKQVNLNLKQAEEFATITDIPANFVYKTSLNNIKKKITDIIKDIDKINIYIDDKLKENRNIEEKEVSAAQSLGNVLQKLKANRVISTASGITQLNTLNSATTLLNNKKNQTIMKAVKSEAIAKRQNINNNWVEVTVQKDKYGFYVDSNGNFAINTNKNGVEFDKDGIAKDYTQFNMMKRAVAHDIPKGKYTKFNKNIDINQNARVLIDDNDSKCGLLIKNKKNEWEFLYYGECISGRNPNLRTKAGEYLTCGHHKGQGANLEHPYFEIEKNKENPQMESRTFFLSDRKN